MGLARIPLSEQEEAHLALILDLFKSDLARIEQLRTEATERQAQRASPLLRAKGIPDGVTINVLGRQGDAPAFITYDAPDIEPAPTEAPPAPAAQSI